MCGSKDELGTTEVMSTKVDICFTCYSETYTGEDVIAKLKKEEK